jgi:hypothetical protein
MRVDFIVIWRNIEDPSGYSFALGVTILGNSDSIGNK